MTLMHFVIGALATWRLASLIVYEDGPFEVFTRLRSISVLEGMTSCLWCTSIWTGLLVTVLLFVAEPVIWPFALSGAAIGVGHVLSQSQHPAK